MADLLYLSYWLNGFTVQNMSRHLERALGVFPFSKLTRSGSMFRVLAVSRNEASLFEQGYDHPLPMAALMSVAREYRQEDVALELETWWDMWQFDGEWKLQPAPVTILAQGAEFESEDGEHLRFELGPQERFLPLDGAPNAVRVSQSNLRSLLRLTNSLDDTLAVAKRRLLTESGENFAERLKDLLGAK